VDVLRSYIRSVVNERLGHTDAISARLIRIIVQQIKALWRELEITGSLSITLENKDNVDIGAASVGKINVEIVYDAEQTDPTKSHAWFDRNVTVKMTVNSLELRRMLPSIISEIQEVLRHELEHAQQFKTHRAELKATAAPQGKMWDYVKQPMEARAWVRGMWRKARYNRIPFTQVIEDRLTTMRRRWESRGVDPQKIETFETRARELWITTAREMGLPIR
jgi:hypothetical protein